MVWQQEELLKFDEGAAEALRRGVPGAAALDKESFTELRNMWTMSFFAWSPDVQDNAVLAGVGRFEAFVKTLIPWDMEKRVDVSFKLGRNYGNEYVEFGLTDVSQPGQPAMKAAADRLIKTVLSEHDDYSARFLARVIGQPVSNGERKQQPSSVMVDEGNIIDVEWKQGKKLFSIRCGRWQKFGVRIWPEVLKEAGIEPDALPPEGMDIGTCDIHYVMKPDGQYPDKVIKIVRRG